MANSVYTINKGINKSIEFKGLKAQYIWWFGGGVVLLLVLYAALYFTGLNTFVSLGVILSCGTGMVVQVYRLSNTHGEHGMMKKIARRNVPHTVKSCNRSAFMPKATARR